MTAGNGVATVAAATGSATGFKLADVRAVWAALPDAYKPNATWLMSPSAFASLANPTDTAGGLVLPSLHAAEPTLYGRPVYQSPELPAAAANARSVVVGDFSVGYAVRRVNGLGVHRQTELHSDSGQEGLCMYGSPEPDVLLKAALDGPSRRLRRLERPRLQSALRRASRHGRAPTRRARAQPDAGGRREAPDVISVALSPTAPGTSRAGRRPQASARHASLGTGKRPPLRERRAHFLPGRPPLSS